MFLKFWRRAGDKKWSLEVEGPRLFHSALDCELEVCFYSTLLSLEMV